MVSVEVALELGKGGEESEVGGKERRKEEAREGWMKERKEKGRVEGREGMGGREGGEGKEGGREKGREGEGKGGE